MCSAIVSVISITINRGNKCTSTVHRRASKIAASAYETKWRNDERVDDRGV